MAALLSFRGGSVQSELDAFLAHLGDRLFSTLVDAGQVRLFKGRRLVCADATVLAPAQRACLRTRCLAAPVQRALGLYLPGNELMLHVAVGPETEGERQMLFDVLDRLRPGDVLILDRCYPASWLVQVLVMRGIDFIIRCDSTRSWGAVRSFMRSTERERWNWLSPTEATQASTWELDGPAQMRVRLVRQISPSEQIRVLVTSLGEEMATAAELGDLYHGRWHIEEAFKHLKQRLSLESVSGLSQHALLVDVASKALA